VVVRAARSSLGNVPRGVVAAEWPRVVVEGIFCAVECCLILDFPRIEPDPGMPCPDGTWLAALQSATKILLLRWAVSSPARMTPYHVTWQQCS